MRASLRWTLAGTLLLTVVALALPQLPGAVGQPPGTASVRPDLQPPVPMSPIAASTLPASVQQVRLEPALRDPFARPSVAANLPQMPPTPEVVAVPAPPAPASPAQAAVPPPPPAYRYLGALTTPAGEQQFFLALGTSELAVGVGSRLPDGHVVVGIGSNVIRLRHGETGTLFDVAVPPLTVR